MTDVFTREKRSEIMSKIRSKGTGPELRVALALRRAGVHFRRHDARLPGTPDFVVTALNVAIFVNGCFWHSHGACGASARFSKGLGRRAKYWREKIAANRRRDRRARRALNKTGWRAMTIWECRTRWREQLDRELRRALLSRPAR